MTAGPQTPFDRLADDARKVLLQARDEAVRHGSDQIGAEHLLLAILDLPCAARSVLERRGLAFDVLREALATVLGQGRADAPTTGQLPFTAEAKQAVAAAFDEAAGLAHAYVGSQHLLLGLVMAPASLPAQVLQRLGIDAEQVRTAVEHSAPAAAAAAMRLLLISNSTMHGGGYLEHCGAEIRDFLGPRQQVLFVPYALFDHDAYTARARRAFAAFGHDLVSVHERGHAPGALASASAVFVGGGNTFRLLTALHHYGLLPAIQARVRDGMPYLGSSAGTNVATPSIRTTNDMPIVQPPSFAALDLVPFQINPHYLDPDPQSRHMGETREERIRQFHEEHATPVLGLREGCLLRREGPQLELRGTTAARLFRRGAEPQEFLPPADLSFLLRA
ncbi:MAG: dipeptidase PepE [Planctomycetes bacterium]|nr:dipeptidase PepE [Planctomycetota bacterium]